MAKEAEQAPDRFPEGEPSVKNVMIALELAQKDALARAEAVRRREAEAKAARAEEKEEAMSATEIIFEVTEDETDGGYSATAMGYGIHSQGDSLEEIRRNVREAVDCYFDDTMTKPRIVRLHFVRDEVFVT